MTHQQPGKPDGTPSRRRFSPLVIVVGVVVVIALVLLAILVGTWLRPGPSLPPQSQSQSSAPSTSGFPPRPSSQPADCPDVQVISVPGTWESKSTDDPYRPTFNPNSLMLKVTGPLASSIPGSRADIWTTPYVAQLSNPVAIPPDGQASYEKSRTEGYDKSVAQIKKVYERCKLTGFVLMGFSQGAVIAGDIAAEIGAGKLIPAENVLGVGLISDPRREPGDARTVGPNPPGVGVEVAYGGFSFGSLSLRGEREGGFGAVKDRTVSLCGTKDPICNQPKDIFQVGEMTKTLPELQKVLTGNSHALYATTADWNLGGQTATQWMQGWARGVIDKAPKPPHS
ncbi:cutinase family protein [Tsukamurella spumae]|uniref:Cutinase family protein n=1 Tax=Tsukamurella spumae TaxID=44753 RepID=A0A846X4M1_9ACTN|nr:cutinase family protein [Tsukamurella spumae]NKY20627.1 cutinase family protein [Tsukamurella spumae]